MREFENNFRAFLGANDLEKEMQEVKNDPFSPKRALEAAHHKRAVTDFNCAFSNNGVPISRASDPTRNETSDEASQYFGTPATNKTKIAHLKTSAQTSV